MRRLLPVLLALACLGSACHHRPRYEPVDEKDIALDSERRLLANADKECDDLDKGGFLYGDKQLEAYVNGVAQTLLTHTATDKHIIVKIMRDPVRNAYAFPNGRIYVNTGFLAAMDNEAQLANLLGHEMTHVLRRHAAREFTSKKKQSTVDTGNESLRRIVIGGNFYSQELESDADEEGLRMMVAAGYDPRESIRMFELLKREADLEKIKVRPAYSDHPAIKERIKSTTEIVTRDYAGREGRKNAEHFIAMTAQLLLDNAALDLKRANYLFAKQGIEKYLAREQNSARAYYLLGEVYREKGEQHSDDKAQESYRNALALKPTYADAYRGLGLLEFGAGRKAEAKKDFQHYLELQPAAPDRDYIRQYIRASR